MILQVEFNRQASSHTLNSIERFARFVDCQDDTFIYDVQKMEDTVILVRLLWELNNVRKIETYNHPRPTICQSVDGGVSSVARQTDYRRTDREHG